MKTHISMEQRICVVCTQKVQTNVILINRNLRPTMDRYTTTGWGVCDQCKTRLNDGYIALVGVDPTRSVNNGDRMKIENAYRSGDIIFIRKEVAAEIFPHFETINFVEKDLAEELKKHASS